MKIESSVTSISWIPSAAIAGVTRVPFEAGMTHYDDPPPDRWDDLDSVVGPEGARFANELRAWIEVEDGQITGYGQGGSGRLSNTLFRVAGMRIQVEAVGYPELRPEPVPGPGFVRFAQTAGGRPGMDAKCLHALLAAARIYLRSPCSLAKAFAIWPAGCGELSRREPCW